MELHPALINMSPSFVKELFLFPIGGQSGLRRPRTTRTKSRGVPDRAGRWGFFSLCVF